ncbi:queuosine precursor transporter [Candidatus Jorgensenbacteria bacterium]|nr:queuosine precursor transporter [Candidatus Jorgensenbacteria bacterium]
MTNELILLLTLFVEFTLIYIVFRLGKEWLIFHIIINMVVIGIVGAKTINVFGFVTNIGNILYTSVFLSTHVLVESYGKKEGYRSILFTYIGMFLSLLLLYLAFLYVGHENTKDVNKAMDVLLDMSPRIAIGASIAFLLSQQINIWIYQYILEKTKRRFLWIRDNVSNIFGQFLDTILFFPIAFYGVIPNEFLFQSMAMGFGIKVLCGGLGTIFLYNFIYRKAKTY